MSARHVVAAYLYGDGDDGDDECDDHDDENDRNCSMRMATSHTSYSYDITRYRP